MKKYSKIHYILYIGILMIIVSSIVNITYLKSQKLDKPVFFEHYYETLVYENDNRTMDFYYLTNADDKTKVVEIYFPDINENIYFAVNNSNVTNYKYYNVTKVNVMMSLDKGTYLQMDKEIVLENAVVYFSNGDNMEVDLGKIVIKKDDYKNTSLDNVMSSVSNTDTSEYIFKAEEPIIINGITTSLLKESKGLIKMKIVADNSDDIRLIEGLHGDNPEKYELELNKRNEEEVDYIAIEDIKLPISVKSILNIYTKFNINDEAKRFNFYRVLYSINYENLDGVKGSEKLLNVRYTPYFTDKNIKSFLKTRGKI